jgi:Xaa-Pro aminopeptidase
MGRHADYDHRIIDWVNTIRAKVRAGAHPPGEFLDLDHHLHDMRLYKSTAELALMREAGRISSAAHMRAMRFCVENLAKNGVNEFQLEAEILHEFARQGARHPAYGCIVGSGKNACILHYHENNQPIKDGDLVLIDAGAEVDHYAADITRTFPANGKFSREQQALYEIVLQSQLEAIAVTKPGAHWNDPHETTVKVITQGLIDLKLLNGELNELIETAAYKPFYMHRAGHWLGMDVHDVGDYKIADEWRVLEPGMVLTVEPGIYIAPDNTSVGRQWRGIGIRIEDDVVVTKSGHEVLTADVVKSVRDIEKWMHTAGRKTVAVANKSVAEKKSTKQSEKQPTKKSAEAKKAVVNKSAVKKVSAKKAPVKKVVVSKAAKSKALVAAKRKPAARN